MDTSSFFESITSLLTIFIAKEAFLVSLNSIAVAGVTYGVLEIFMQRPTKRDTIKYPSNKDSMVGACWLVVLSALVPWTVAVLQAIQPYYGTPMSRMTGSITNILISIVIGYVLCWLFSLNLKRFITTYPTDTENERKQKENVRKERILFTYALYQLGNMLQKNVSNWITTSLQLLGGIILEVFHYQFIRNYALWSILINMALSLFLVSIMGSSSSAGSANMIGSLIGGAVHAILRIGKVRELRNTYIQEGKFKENANEPT